MERKLPILPTLVAAFDLCREQSDYAFRISAPWFVILLIAPYLLIAMLGDNSDVPDTAPMQLWEIVLMVLVTIGWSMIAVLWHWRILRSESRGQQVVTFDERVWFYTLRWLLVVTTAIVIAMLLMIPVLILMMVFARDSIFSNDFMLSFAAMLVISGFIMARFSVALPAVALRVREFGLRRAWTATAGNGMRLFVLTALPIFPILAISWVVDIIGFGGAKLYEISPIPALTHTVVQSLDFAFGVLSLAVLSLTYAFFVERGNAGAIATS